MILRPQLGYVRISNPYTVKKPVQQVIPITHYPPWVDTSTSNIAALWNCYFFPTSGQNTFVEASFLLNKNKFNFVSPKINVLHCFMSQ